MKRQVQTGSMPPGGKCGFVPRTDPLSDTDRASRNPHTFCENRLATAYNGGNVRQTVPKVERFFGPALATLLIEYLVMYHDRSYRLLGTTAGEHTASIRGLRDVEQRLKLTLPKSMLEWYKREDGIAILRQHSNDDPPISLADMQLVRWNSRILLPIRRENQGVCTWAIELDGSDDPPVWVDVDTDGNSWNPCADTFSDYVLSCIWDYKRVFDQPALVGAQNSPLSAETLESLAQYEQDVLTHGWPGSTQYRFFSRTGTILIWSNYDQADWWVAAPTARELSSVLRTVWHFDHLGARLYDCSDEGRVALAKVGTPTSPD